MNLQHEQLHLGLELLHFQHGWLRLGHELWHLGPGEWIWHATHFCMEGAGCRSLILLDACMPPPDGIKHQLSKTIAAQLFHSWP